MNLKKTETKAKFLITHADKLAMDRAQINFYITVCKLLRVELEKLTEKRIKQARNSWS